MTFHCRLRRIAAVKFRAGTLPKAMHQVATPRGLLTPAAELTRALIRKRILSDKGAVRRAGCGKRSLEG